jgi:hypothetical protein
VIPPGFLSNKRHKLDDISMLIEKNHKSALEQVAQNAFILEKRNYSPSTVASLETDILVTLN